MALTKHDIKAEYPTAGDSRLWSRPASIKAADIFDMRLEWRIASGSEVQSTCDEICVSAEHADKIGSMEEYKTHAHRWYNEFKRYNP